MTLPCLVGYARVSTQDQKLEFQREALAKAGCQKLFEDKASGTLAESLGLVRTLEMLREGDTLAVWKLDRLSHRNGARADGGAPRSIGGRPAVGPHRRTQAEDDQQQNRVSQEVAR